MCCVSEQKIVSTVILIIMAEDEDGVSNKNSPQNSNDSGSPEENEQNSAKPDLGIEEAKYNSKENGHASPTEPNSSSSSECFTNLFFPIYNVVLLK